MIGDDIVVKVLSITRGGTVRLGVQAPANVGVYREELVEQVKANGGQRIKRKEKNAKDKKG